MTRERVIVVDANSITNVYWNILNGAVFDLAMGYSVSIPRFADFVTFYGCAGAYRASRKRKQYVAFNNIPELPGFFVLADHTCRQWELGILPGRHLVKNEKVSASLFFQGFEWEYENFLSQLDVLFTQGAAVVPL